MIVFAVLAWAGGIAPVFAQSAARDLPDACGTGGSFTVSITIVAPPGTVVVNFEDAPPTGWTDINNISNGGTYDSVHHKVKWGPFFSNLSRTVTYDVTPPGQPVGENCFAGTVWFNGIGQPIEGHECCQGSILGDFDGDSDVDLKDYSQFADCMAGPGEWPNPTGPVTLQDCLDVFDVDTDDDVDGVDMAEFQRSFTGS